MKDDKKILLKTRAKIHQALITLFLSSRVIHWIIATRRLREQNFFLGES